MSKESLGRVKWDKKKNIHEVRDIGDYVVWNLNVYIPTAIRDYLIHFRDEEEGLPTYIYQKKIEGTDMDIFQAREKLDEREVKTEWEELLSDLILKFDYIAKFPDIEYEEDIYEAQEALYYKYLKEAFETFSEILPYLWW